jgi:hypothetical protein
MKPRHLLAFLSLPRGERRLLLQALIGLPATALALRLFGFNRWYTGLRRLVRPRRKLAVPNMMRAYRIARLVRLANGRLRPSANCLRPPTAPSKPTPGSNGKASSSTMPQTSAAATPPSNGRSCRGGCGWSEQ